MRIAIFLKTRKLPIFYRHRIISFIKEALKTANPEYYEKLYSAPLGKPFTFWLRLPKDRITNKESIQIDKNFTVEEDVFQFKENSKLLLVISSSDFLFLVNLYNGLLGMREYPFSSEKEMLINGQSLTLNIERVREFPEKRIFKREIYFETRTPIVVPTKEGYLTFEDEDFEEALNFIINRRFSSPFIAGRKLKEPIKFEPIKMEKKVIKHTLKGFREKTGKPIMFIDGSVGIFKLTGHPEDLSLLYKVGLGSRCSQGFGMVEVLR